MKQFFITLSSSLFVFCYGCTKTPDEKPSNNSSNCLDHLKGKSFETYKVDSQSFDGQTDSAISSKGSFSVDSLSDWYVIQTFNAHADSVTKTAEGWTFPTRSFQIKGNSMFYGDDEMPFENCSVKGYAGTIFKEGSTPDSYIKMKVYFRVKK